MQDFLNTISCDDKLKNSNLAEEISFYFNGLYNLKEHLLNKKEPSDKEIIELYEAQKSFNEITAILGEKSTLEDYLKKFEVFLNIRWERIYQTFLAYPCWTLSPLTKLCHAIAKILKLYHDDSRSAYQFLMFTLINTKSEFENLDDLPLGSFTLDGSGREPLSIEILACSEENNERPTYFMWKKTRTEALKESRLLHNFYTNKPLTKDQLSRLINLSIETQELDQACENYFAVFTMPDHTGSIRANLKELLNALKGSSIQGMGEEEIAHESIYNAIVKFNLFLSNLPDDIKEQLFQLPVNPTDPNEVETFRDIWENITRFSKTNKLVGTICTNTQSIALATLLSQPSHVQFLDGDTSKGMLLEQAQKTFDDRLKKFRERFFGSQKNKENYPYEGPNQKRLILNMVMDISKNPTAFFDTQYIYKIFPLLMHAKKLFENSIDLPIDQIKIEMQAALADFALNSNIPLRDDLISSFFKENNVALPAIKTFLAKNIEHINTKGYSFGGKNTLLHEAIFYNNVEVVQYLVEKGADPNNIPGTNGESSLTLAILHNSIACVKLLVKLKNIDLNFQNNQGNTALHLAAANNHGEVIELLISAGADPWIENNDNHTVIEIAAINKHWPMVEFLISLLSKNRNLSSKPIIGMDIDSGSESETSDEMSIDSESEASLSYENVLLLAVKNNQPNIVNILLELGTDPNLFCPIEWAIRNRNHEIFVLLIQYGANLEAAIDYHSLSMTPLSLAAKFHWKEAVVTLIEAGVDFFKTSFGYKQSLRGWAIQHGYTDILKLVDEKIQASLCEAINKNDQATLDMIMENWMDNYANINWHILNYLDRNPASVTQIGNLIVTKQGVESCLLDEDNYYTSDFINLLLLPLSLNFKEKVKVYFAATLKVLESEYAPLILTQKERYAFIPLNVSYNEVKNTNETNHWITLIFDKKIRVIYWLDPATHEKNEEEQYYYLINIFPYLPARLKQAFIGTKYLEFSLQIKEQEANWIRHCGVYIVEIFKFFSNLISNNNEAIGLKQLKNISSMIPHLNIDDPYLLRKKHILEVAETLGINWINLPKPSPLILPDDEFLIKYIKDNNLLMVERLLTLGANPNLPDASGEVPLMIAIAENNRKMVRYLLEKGAGINEYYQGELPLVKAIMRFMQMEFIKEKEIMLGIIRDLIDMGANPSIDVSNLPYSSETIYDYVNKLDSITKEKIHVWIEERNLKNRNDSLSNERNNWDDNTEIVEISNNFSSDFLPDEEIFCPISAPPLSRKRPLPSEKTTNHEPPNKLQHINDGDVHSSYYSSSHTLFPNSSLPTSSSPSEDNYDNEPLKIDSDEENTSKSLFKNNRS